MDTNKKVFSSDIVRSDYRYQNDLQSLLNIVPAKPLQVNDNKKYTCDFVPKTDKIYIPKKNNKSKVKTVRHIRMMFENDIYAYLINDLEAQQKYLLNKIKSGTAKNENTVRIAKKLLESKNPLTRSTWQMLLNINPENHRHPQQFVIWNGRYIQVNGSHGGQSQLIYPHDLACTKQLSVNKKKSVIKTNTTTKKKGLLRNSLAIKFKPGPLQRKKFLDDSHQRYQGDIELVHLPKVGLVVQPKYGTALEPTITQFLNNLRREDGTITKKWAEFAISVLGGIKKSDPVICSNENVKFDLQYKCDQHRILMRKDLDSGFYSQIPVNKNFNENMPTNQNNIMHEIKDVLNKMLDAVEININQDSMFTEDESLKQFESSEKNTMEVPTLSKDKSKRKYGELDRLDVTVIQLPARSETHITKNCGNAYCNLGCVCDSIKNTYKFRQHCGREDCMFACKCDFSKYINLNNSLHCEGNDLIPGMINIEDEINMRLAKEEQKFHQTVIVTGEKNILLKTEKRILKSSNSYVTHYKNVTLNNRSRKKRELSISIQKLNCENIEPWCMVHNLYKCFCQGKFTERASSLLFSNSIKEPALMDTCFDEEYLADKTEKVTNTNEPDKQFLRLRVRQDLNVAKAVNMKSSKPDSETSNDILAGIDDSDCNNTCSRVNPYRGRKYIDEHYKNTNQKIKEMEKNDKNLIQKIINIINTDSEASPENAVDDDEEEKTIVKDSDNDKTLLNNKSIKKNQDDRTFTQIPNDQNFIKFLYDINGDPSNNDDSSKIPKKLFLSHKNKLVDWLESNYKLYKQRIDQGLFKSSLDPPKVGKVALYPWEFILSRYRERKNLFMISKQTPYRIFMGINAQDPFFESCININEIRFADLHKYPQTVKNLLTNATDLKDNFCILRGSANFWELVGAVTKVSKNSENPEEINDDSYRAESNQLQSDNSDEQPYISYLDQPACLDDSTNTVHCAGTSESSKWFVMTVENDFSEIRFFKKGFFVKYESIVKAINVSRLSGKTVRLSSQKCAERNNDPQFGVYAIPNANEYCVFIGPYEVQDTLGIETIKSFLNLQKSKRTRGFWLVTNKVDNLKVIDNPFSFMPQGNVQNNQAIPLENHFKEGKYLMDEEKTDERELQGSSKNTYKIETKRMVKPIKIRKTNGFYHLATGGSLKMIALKSPPKVASLSNVNLFACSDIMKEKRGYLEAHSKNSDGVENDVTLTTNDFQIEKETNIKITSIYSEKEDIKTNTKMLEGGMLILKPEEINRKLLAKKINTELAISTPTTTANVSENLLNTKENENLLFQDDIHSATLTPCPKDTDVCVISDDDNDMSSSSENIDQCKLVVIQCTDATNIGCVLGRQKCDSLLLSFKIPGQDYSKFYTEEDAFKQLNNELSRIINPSKPFNLNWQVMSPKDLAQDVNPLDIENIRTLISQENLSSQPSLQLIYKTYSKKKSARVALSAHFTSKLDEEVYQKD